MTRKAGDAIGAPRRPFPECRARQKFRPQDAGESEGLDWVEARPRVAEGGFEKLRLGFRAANSGAWNSLDNFGQTTLVRFSKSERNPALPPSLSALPRRRASMSWETDGRAVACGCVPWGFDGWQGPVSLLRSRLASFLRSDLGRLDPGGAGQGPRFLAPHGVLRLAAILAFVLARRDYRGTAPGLQNTAASRWRGFSGNFLPGTPILFR